MSRSTIQPALCLPTSLYDLLAIQDQVITRDQSLTFMSETELGNHLRIDWQIMLPGVYFAGRGTPTYRQRLHGAVLYGGPLARISDLSALITYRVRYLPEDATIRLLLGAAAMRANRDGVAVRRTHRLPEARIIDGLPYAPPERAVVDCAARLGDRRTAIALIADVVQRRLASVAAVAEEGTHLSGRGAAVTRAAIAVVVLGVRSAPEADFLHLCESTRSLPRPMLNPLLRLPGGRLISPDALFLEAALVHEVNSREFHEDEDRFENTQERHDALETAGFAVLHNTPRQVRGEGRRIQGQVAALLRD